jgi:hypothetical protein
MGVNGLWEVRFYFFFLLLLSLILSRSVLACTLRFDPFSKPHILNWTQEGVLLSGLMQGECAFAIVGGLIIDSALFQSDVLSDGPYTPVQAFNPGKEP